MDRRFHIEQADANKFFDFLIKSRSPSTLSTDSERAYPERYPHAILADAYGIGLGQAEELYLNWLDMMISRSGTPL